MLLAIDTDLLKAALQDKDAKRAVEWLVEKIEDLQFALDKSRVLLREYKDFLDEISEDSLPYRFLAELLKRQGTQTHTLQSECDYDVQALVQTHCNQPIEPTLIGMGCHAKHLDYRILLSGTEQRQRGLRKEQVQSAICKQLKMQVIFPNTQISFPALEEKSKVERDFWFEDKCQAAIQKIYSFQCGRKPTPKVIEQSVGDVDVYGYTLKGNSRLIWVGECKLFWSDRNNYVERQKVVQLEQKLRAVQDYEESQLIKGGKVEIKRFVISNGVDMRSSAWALLASIQATFLQVSLSQNWQSDPRWRIERLEEFEPYQTENYDENGGPIWAGRKIKTYEL